MLKRLAAPSQLPSSPSSHSVMLGQIAAEVEEYCPHPDCTTLQAVQLMKCRLKEYEIADLRRQIERSWQD